MPVTFHTTTLTNLNIWDGEKCLDADTLQFTGEHIRFLGSRENLAAKTPTVNCNGLTAIPGLIDAHVHLELNPDASRPPVSSEPDLIPLMAERARAMARAGITTARDLGGGAWFELDLRDRIQQGRVLGPRLLCAGQPITTPNGHCHFWGGGASTPDKALTVLRRQVNRRVDLIKLMATGGRLTPGSKPTDVQFSQPTLNTLVAAAHARGLPVAAHCHGTEGIHRAARARARVNTIEHCSWAGPEGWASDFQEEIARVILNNGAWVSPTVNKGWQRMLDASAGETLERVRGAYEKMLSMGISMVAGTDAGIPGVFHNDLPEALVVFSKIARLSPEATLRSATSGAAIGLGIAGITGSLAPGKAADIVLLDGNPLEDLTALTRAVGVYCRGRPALTF